MSVKLLSLKTILLLALVSAKRVGELHPSQACLNFSLDDSKVTLTWLSFPKPVIQFITALLWSCVPFTPFQFLWRSVHYINRTQSFRKNDQLSISLATQCKAK